MIIKEIEVKDIMTKTNLPVSDFFFCSVTDPYQSVEKKYGRTRALLEQLLPTGISISISTKSDLILRDLDLSNYFYHEEITKSAKKGK